MRDYREVNWDELNALIFTDPDYTTAYFTYDVEILTELFQGVLNINLDKMTPLQKVRSGKKNTSICHPIDSI